MQLIDFSNPYITFDLASFFWDGTGAVKYTVVAPPQDPPGAALMAQIAVLQMLVLTNTNLLVLPQMLEQLNQAEVEAVDHFMVTGWLNAATILAMYQPLPNDKVGQVIKARVAFLQNLFNNAPAPPPGNVEGYGGGGWVTVAQNYQQQLYAAQIALVERIVDCPGATSAHTILTTLVGFQSFPFEYAFTSVGFTDAWIDD